MSKLTVKIEGQDGWSYTKDGQNVDIIEKERGIVLQTSTRKINAILLDFTANEVVKKWVKKYDIPKVVGDSVLRGIKETTTSTGINVQRGQERVTLSMLAHDMLAYWNTQIDRDLSSKEQKELRAIQLKIRDCGYDGVLRGCFIQPMMRKFSYDTKGQLDTAKAREKSEMYWEISHQGWTKIEKIGDLLLGDNSPRESTIVGLEIPVVHMTFDKLEGTFHNSNYCAGSIPANKTQMGFDLEFGIHKLDS